MQGGGERNRERGEEKKGKTSSNNIERSYILELSEGHALERKNQGGRKKTKGGDINAQD